MQRRAQVPDKEVNVGRQQCAITHPGDDRGMNEQAVHGRILSVWNQQPQNRSWRRRGGGHFFHKT